MIICWGETKMNTHALPSLSTCGSGDSCMTVFVCDASVPYGYVRGRMTGRSCSVCMHPGTIMSSSVSPSPLFLRVPPVSQSAVHSSVSIVLPDRFTWICIVRSCYLRFWCDGHYQHIVVRFHRRSCIASVMRNVTALVVLWAL